LPLPLDHGPPELFAVFRARVAVELLARAREPLVLDDVVAGGALVAVEGLLGRGAGQPLRLLRLRSAAAGPRTRRARANGCV
jgi:hypothetical protein